MFFCYNIFMEKFNFKNIRKKVINYTQTNPKKVSLILSVLVFIIIIIIVLITIFSNTNIETSQKYVEYNGKNLDENKYPGYKSLMDDLLTNYPNWSFTLFYTKLNWDDVISNEGHVDDIISPLNLIPNSSKYPDDWKCEIDKDKTFDNGTWLCASDKAISYNMDPRNILNYTKILQFLELNYVENSQTIDGLKSMTQNTFLEGNDISYALIQAGKNSDINPYFIASRLIQEQGKSGTVLSKGYEYNGVTVYNPFNINATGNSSETILQNAASYAYDHNWYNLEKGLIEGVDFLKKSYIGRGQNTLYLQKFDIVNQDNSLYSHQYMQNLLAPTSESNILLDIYESSNTLNSNFNFIVPLYENMPKETSSY